MSKYLDDGVDISVQLRHVCLEYPFKSLQAATNNFHQSKQLGEGSAGTVFKAEMQDGSYAAVKVIDLATLGDNFAVAGFEEEVMILSKFRHPNVVVLMGWAREKSRRFLIYEFLGGGDVYGRLQKCKDGRSPFLWYERLAVCRDAAMGLAHLHNATPHAFHRDVKTANILLGPSGAKIADFGLSVVGKTRTQSAVDCENPSGTPGYTCPTYIQTGTMTEGSEVYSFGMVLLEVLMNMMPAGIMGQEMIYPIQDCIQPGYNGDVDRAVGAADPAAGWPPPVAWEVAALGLKCIDYDEARRPSFNEICHALRFLQENNPPTCIMQAQPPPMRPPGMPMPTGVLNVSIGPSLGIGMRPPAPPMPGAPGMAFVPPTGHPVPGGGLIQIPGPPWQMGPGRPAFPHTGHFMVQPPVPQPGPPVPKVMLVQQVPGPPHIAVGPGRPPQPVHIVVQRPVAGPPGPSPANVVEAALEVAHVHGMELSQLSPEIRMLPLLPVVDSVGRRSVVLGRQHQPQWFEVLLNQNDLSCISRDAFEMSWGGPDPSQAALSLRVLGSNIVLVDDVVVNPGMPIGLNPGSRITFAFQGNGNNLFIILAFLVHCAPQLAAPGQGRRPPGVTPPVGCPTALGRPPFHGGYGRGNGHAPLPTAAPGAVQVQVDAVHPQNDDQEGAWLFECIYAAGLGPEGLWNVPPTLRNLPLHLTPEAGAKVIGRTYHPDLFEALLSHEPSLLSCISRSHIQLEAKQQATVLSIDSLPNNEIPTLVVTNLSNNPVVANRVNLEPTMKALYQNETAEVHDGDTLSFACEQQDTASHQPDEAPNTQAIHASGAQLAAAVSAVSPERQGSSILGTTVLGRDDGEAAAALVPFLTLRVSAPPVPPPPSPFVMMSPMSAVSVETRDPEDSFSWQASTLNRDAPEFTPYQMQEGGRSSASSEEVNLLPVPEEGTTSPPRLSSAQSEVGYGLRRSAPVVSSSEFPNPSADSPQHRCGGDTGAPSTIASTVPAVNRSTSAKVKVKRTSSEKKEKGDCAVN